MNNNQKVQIDTNAVIDEALQLEKTDQGRFLRGLKKIKQLTWAELHKDRGLKWEEILSKRGPNGEKLYSLRFS